MPFDDKRAVDLSDDAEIHRSLEPLKREITAIRKERNRGTRKSKRRTKEDAPLICA